MSFVYYYPEISRLDRTFDLRFDYTVAAYRDPVTHVVDPSSRWSCTIDYDAGGQTFFGGGEVGRRATEFVDLALADTGTVVGYTITFHAENATGDSAVDKVLRVEDATSVTTAVHLAGGVQDDFLLGGSAADVARGGLGKDHLDGGAGDDRLFGGADHDVLDGGLGADLLVGGGGSDDYFVNSAGDVAIEDPGARGTDRVFTSVDWTLGAGFEQLFVDGARTGIGNDLDNLIVGLSGANRLEGGEGDDALEGRDGQDVLIGGNGNDLLDGGGNDDLMIGGAGDDRYYVDGRGDTIEETAHGGTDTVYLAYGLRSYTLAANVENLEIGSKTGRFTAIGNDSANVMTGSSAGNRLSGLGGDDTLIGSYATDIYAGGAGADRFLMSLVGGHDRILDFNAAEGDVIELHAGSAFDSFDEVMAAARSRGPDGADTLITISDNATILLRGVTLDMLTPESFAFG